ncbi:MAG TPA: 16S rRNA (guanine(527)-N(7))-methyltransferase RsmG [Saprospiraceae bacterium]|nr:16S rRNA (guanine(527)-N(7))-methyltransferase RsmG [Saprospiraceae bacterium]
MELIKAYFPDLSELQYEQLQRLGLLYKEWNSKINVISRKDIDNVYDHHILHSMAIAKFIRFQAGANVLDLGTGGGLPGLPMAILFPQTNFRLIDGTRKKITVVQAIKEDLGLKNVVARQKRAEEMKERFDFVICRAVASLDKLFEWSSPLLSKKEKHAFPNGLITLKGGDLDTEAEALPRGSYVDIIPLSQYYEEPFFEEKAIVYVQG